MPTIRVAVISDTHLPRFGLQLPVALVDALRGEAVDRIVHCGDWTEPFALDLLNEIAPTDGVAGNNDGPELHARLGTHRSLDIAGARIGVTHGHLGAGRTTPERARRAFEHDASVRAVLFGHSHIPFLERTPGGVLLLNPGSPTDKRRQPRPTWALLTIEEEGSAPMAEIRTL